MKSVYGKCSRCLRADEECTLVDDKCDGECNGW